VDLLELVDQAVVVMVETQAVMELQILVVAVVVEVYLEVELLVELAVAV
jgi:hypothetical protein